LPAVALIWHLAAPFVPYPVRVFGGGDIVAAVDWLDGLSDGGFSVELRERDGIVWRAPTGRCAPRTSTPSPARSTAGPASTARS